MKNGKILSALGTLLLGSMTAKAMVVDLISGNTGTANGAQYDWTDQQSTGTGVIDPFLRIQHNVAEQGYNTSYGTPWDTKAGTWTHELKVSDLVAVTLGGTSYYQFLLDINQDKGSDHELLSLNNIQIFTSGTLITMPAESLAGLGTLRFNSDVGADGDSTVNLDFQRNPGSGAGDMFAYVPASLFAGAAASEYVYFYSQFGDPNYNSNDGFEEWALVGTSTPVPEASTVLVGCLLFGVLAWRERSRFQLALVKIAA